MNLILFQVTPPQSPKHLAKNDRFFKATPPKKTPSSPNHLANGPTVRPTVRPSNRWVCHFDSFRGVSSTRRPVITLAGPLVFS